MMNRANGEDMNREQQRQEMMAETASTESAAARDSTDFVRRSHRAAIVFRLGAVALGAVGCSLGACMPYSHPAALTISVLWWGMFLGCLGGSLTVLLCVLAERTSSSDEAYTEGSLGNSNPTPSTLCASCGRASANSASLTPRSTR
jgi:hypothetical protein